MCRDNDVCRCKQRQATLQRRHAATEGPVARVEDDAGAGAPQQRCDGRRRSPAPLRCVCASDDESYGARRAGSAVHDARGGAGVAVGSGGAQGCEGGGAALRRHVDVPSVERGGRSSSSSGSPLLRLLHLLVVRREAAGAAECAQGRVAPR